MDSAPDAAHRFAANHHANWYFTGEHLFGYPARGIRGTRGRASLLTSKTALSIVCDLLDLFRDGTEMALEAENLTADVCQFPVGSGMVTTENASAAALG